MIIGVGVDILSLNRFNTIMQGKSDSFVRRTYSTNELAEAHQRDNSILFYASRFAAKEAVFKALGAKGDFIDLRDISIQTLPTGQPEVQLMGSLKAHADSNSISQIKLSISYETDYVVAFAVTE
ncbi:holo-ACP synthase [Bacillus sp. B15-48]|uniref:holo-ACP synthase n=1 Tax=Bacillus sp. B15-48 TaxID=1548601 RepID=UPI00193F0E30|nr:holo-ACP synthase [Bacillus sp. B15-48]MBM4764591.1 holo-[acyl-carrier-protein] synthase [Bacillus sp. B15-48]